jgi:cytochrome d ubiquinol oxidase subunit II
MGLAELPLAIVLVGLALYVILGGADFGAAFWELLGGRGETGERVRKHAHLSMAPVWEANHVWLIFVLTVTWTAYPVAFGSLASTLGVALFLAGLGIIVRGAAYALRSGTSAPRQLLAIDTASAVASFVTPFTLGAAVGGIASGRVPVGNAAGSAWESWLNPTSITIGLVSVANCAYLSAVFLAGDAQRRDDADAAEAFRRRALAAGGVSGVLALIGLIVLHGDARDLFDGLIGGAGTVGVVVSALAGVGTVALVLGRRYEPARLTAALAVAAIIAGWALAQEPRFLPGLTVEQAAAPDATLVATLLAIGFGAVVLFPSLALLFRLALGGHLGSGDAGAPAAPRRDARVLSASREGMLTRAAGACLLVGVVMLNVIEAGWAHAIGAVALGAFVVLGFFAVVPELVAQQADDPAG